MRKRNCQNRSRSGEAAFGKLVNDMCRTNAKVCRHLLYFLYYKQFFKDYDSDVINCDINTSAYPYYYRDKNTIFQIHLV